MCLTSSWFDDARVTVDAMDILCLKPTTAVKKGIPSVKLSKETLTFKNLVVTAKAKMKAYAEDKMVENASQNFEPPSLKSMKTFKIV